MFVEPSFENWCLVRGMGILDRIVPQFVPPKPLNPLGSPTVLKWIERENNYDTDPEK
jgi:hypothetical protein